MELKVGQVVIYLGGGVWKPRGTVEMTQPAVTMNGSVLIKPMYRIRWLDNGELSSWMFGHELKVA